MSRIGLLIMSQQLLKVSTLCQQTCTKTATPLVNCFVSDALVLAVSDWSSAIYKE